ncbi:MAG: nucleotidyltransferase domain-containing protein [Deltaproteobacteria bacterium]|nr:nucleotidyltransferase domain-containing protein [Deltaproteobacteria bacterium]
MMATEDLRILAEFAKRVRHRYPEARIWAFGSRSRGEADLEADLDVCIVLDHLDNDIDRWIRATAWEVGFENERVIATIVLDADQFENGPMSESSLVANILREGVAA